MHKLIHSPLRFLILFLGMCFLCVTACDSYQSRSCRIEGEIIGEYEGDLILLRKVRRELVPIDTVQVKQGRFQFKSLILASPEMLYIQPEARDVLIQLFAENSDIQLSIPADSMRQTRIRGSAAHADFADFLQNNKAYTNKLSDVYRQRFTAEKNGDSNLVFELDSIMQFLLREQESFLYRYVLENDKCHTAAYIASEKLAPALDYESLKKIPDNFSLELSVSVYYKNLQEAIKRKEALQVGKSLPDAGILKKQYFSEADYLRIIFPFPDSLQIKSLQNHITKHRKLYVDSNLQTLIIWPQKLSAGFAVDSSEGFHYEFFENNEYERLRMVYDVNFAFKNFIIGKDSLILKSGNYLKDIDDYYKTITEKKSEQ